MKVETTTTHSVRLEIPLREDLYFRTLYANNVNLEKKLVIGGESNESPELIRAELLRIANTILLEVGS